MEDIEYNVEWFIRQIDYWHEFAVDMGASWIRLNMVDDLPTLSERFPAEIREVVPKLNSVRAKLLDNHEQAEKEMRAMEDAMERTAKQYAETNAENQEQVEKLKGMIDE